MSNARILARGAICAAVFAFAASVAAAHRLPLPQRSGLEPLWQTQAVEAPRQLTALSLPEDAAWEGWIAPAVTRASPLPLEFHGKLYLSVPGAAGHVAANGLVAWDGTRFEAAPALPGTVTALAVWNDHLVASTTNPGCFMMLNGAAWDTLGHWSGSWVWTMTAFGSDLVVGGALTSVGGQPVNAVARFNGTTWTNMGAALTFPTVRTLIIHAGQLIAGGDLGSVSNVVAWNEGLGTWQTLGAGLNNSVYTLASDGTTLYAAGLFTSSGAVPMAGQASWDGVSWHAMPPAIPRNGSDPRLVAWNGGVVLNLRTAAPSRLSFWNGTQWTAMSDSLTGTLAGLVTYVGTWQGKLVATGSFTRNGIQPAPFVALYDGVQWQTISESWDDQMLAPEGNVNDLMEWNGKLIATGVFGLIAERDHWIEASDIAAWDGAHWSVFGSGLRANLMWLGTYQGDLIATGWSLFSPTSPPARWGVARWNGTQWSRLGTGAPDFVVVGKEFHNDLYVGHDDFEGGGVTDGIRRWNGSTWSNVGGGLVGSGGGDALANDLCVMGDSLVVVGDFVGTEALAFANVAFWDGTAWHPAGAGFNDFASSVVMWNGQLIAGGDFTASGGQPLHGAARWDGTSWQPFGSNATEIVELHTYGNELFASGDFLLPDLTEVESVARWTGSEWDVLGSGSPNYAFAIQGGYLYQAGKGLIHGHVSHGISRVPLGAVLGVPHPPLRSPNLALAASPNPARASVALSFALPSAGHVRLTIHDVSGREVARIADGEYEAGPQRLSWSLERAKPGIYFARLETPAGERSARFIALGR